MKSSPPRSVTLFFRLFEFSRNFFEFSDYPDISDLYGQDKSLLLLLKSKDYRLRERERERERGRERRSQVFRDMKRSTLNVD